MKRASGEMAGMKTEHGKKAKYKGESHMTSVSKSLQAAYPEK